MIPTTQELLDEFPLPKKNFVLKMTENSALLNGYYIGAIVNGVKVLGIEREYKSCSQGFWIKVIEFNCELV